jgi:hypothetical protein
VDSQVADSACSATAYLSGIKANIGTIGVTGNVKVNDCPAMLKAANRVTSIVKWSQVRSFIFPYNEKWQHFVDWIILIIHSSVIQLSSFTKCLTINISQLKASTRERKYINTEDVNKD